MYYTIPGGYLETTPSGYIEGMASMMGAVHGKAQWILRAGQTCCVPSRRSPGGCSDREADHVAAKRLVKYLHGTRDTALELQPRKGTLRLHIASDSDWAGCPTTRKSSSGALVWLSGALVSSLWRTQGLIALSSPDAEYYACTVGVAEATFVQSVLFD